MGKQPELEQDPEKNVNYLAYQDAKRRGTLPEGAKVVVFMNGGFVCGARTIEEALEAAKKYREDHGLTCDAFVSRVDSRVLKIWSPIIRARE